VSFNNEARYNSMLFDSLTMAKLLAKYEGLRDYEIPEVVYLGRSPEMAADRDYLEELVSTAPLTEAKRQDWINRFVKDDYAQYKPSWFEIMLYGWLRDVGNVEVNPSLLGNDPDFVLTINSQQIVIEAYALLEYDEERAWQQRMDELMGVLHEIEKPFFVEIDNYEPDGPLARERLKADVIQWLDAAVSPSFTFQDENGNKISLRVASDIETTHLAVFGSGRSAIMVSSDPLKDPLRKKASQHKAIRRAGYPYVIAVLLDPWQLSAESVVEAWLGEMKYVWNLNNTENGELVGDLGSGLHVFGSAVRHTSVSGTLAFRAMRNRTLERNVLVGWYIENPFAKVPLGPNLFPVVASYQIINKGQKSLKMGWQEHGVRPPNLTDTVT
jgi:hypothetical protein